MYIFPGYVRYREDSGAIVVCSALLQNKVKLTDPAIQEEFRALFQSGGCSELSTPLTRFLHEQELLASKEEVDRAVETFSRLLNDTLLLTIMPTEGCNFRCPYCYEDHAVVSMRREILDRIQEYLTEHAPDFARIHIAWFGGEPTLCKDVILETNRLVQSLQEKYGFYFSSAMTTNGYLLDERNFKEYYAAGITQYQITLDGWDHDKTRPHVSGRGTLQTILSNMESLSGLSEEEYSFRITLRRNILAGDMDFTWYDHLNKLFGGDKRFYSSVAIAGDWGGETVKALDIIPKEDAEKFKTAHEAYLAKIGMQMEGPDDRPFSYVCYASYPYGFVFRPDGQIEKCTIALGEPKNAVGYIDPDVGVILDPAANHLWTASCLRPECYTCSNILNCLNLSCRRRTLTGQSEEVCPYAKISIYDEWSKLYGK